MNRPRDQPQSRPNAGPSALPMEEDAIHRDIHRGVGHVAHSRAEIIFTQPDLWVASAPIYESSTETQLGAAYVVALPKDPYYPLQD